MNEEELNQIFKAVNQMRKEIHGTYQEVIKKFPEITENIQIDTVAKDIPAELSMLNTSLFSSIDEVEFTPTLYIGSKFFELNKDEQEAAVAHELSHYICDREKSIERLVKERHFCRKLEEYREAERDLGKIITFLDKKEKLKMKGIQKWKIKDEISADNYVIKKGYGPSLLLILKKSTKKHADRLSDTGKEEIKARIENLEQKLGDEMFNLVREEKRKQAYNIYREVVKNFPNVKEDEIKITYDSCGFYGAGYGALNEEKTKKEPGMFVGRYFFNLTREEQEGAMAHEIGHHETMKDYTIPSLRRIAKWTGMYNANLIPDSRPHWKERLKKWYILNEMAADNRIAKTKYGKIYLKSYKKHLDPSNEIHQSLIENLEAKLGEENV